MQKTRRLSFLQNLLCQCHCVSACFSARLSLDRGVLMTIQHDSLHDERKENIWLHLCDSYISQATQASSVLIKIVTILITHCNHYFYILIFYQPLFVTWRGKAVNILPLLPVVGTSRIFSEPMGSFVTPPHLHLVHEKYKTFLKVEVYIKHSDMYIYTSYAVPPSFFSIVSITCLSPLLIHHPMYLDFWYIPE